MLSGNKLVIILPLFVVVFILYGGFVYLNEINIVTNEDLHQVVEFSGTMETNPNDVSISGFWDWKEMPQEGLFGEDYIGVSLWDQDNEEFISGDIILETSLQLYFGNKTILEIEGQIVENGVIFPFPNEIIEHESYGNNGKFEVSYLLEHEDRELVASIVYLHTWEEHSGLVMEDARMVHPRFLSEEFDAYWTMERRIP